MGSSKIQDYCLEIFIGKLSDEAAQAGRPAPDHSWYINF